MNKTAILGGLLFVSLAANVYFGSITLGKELSLFQDARSASERIKALPEPQRAEAQAIVTKYRPLVKQQMSTLSKTRKDAFAFLIGKDYDRTKAEEQFKAVREQTTAIQLSMQNAGLDLADKLTPEQRAEVMRLSQLPDIDK